MAEARTHTRVIQSLLGASEKRLLIWIASRLPAWVTPDLLTGLGIFASILIFVSFILTNIHPGFLWLASFGILLNWFGDSLDGTLARVRHIERPVYGFFVDHAVDALSEVLVFVGVGLSPYVDFRVALLCLIAYLLLSIYTYLYTYVKGVFRISFAYLGPTEVRIMAIIANAIVFFVGAPQITFRFGTASFYTVFLAVLGFALFVAFLVSSLTTAMELAKHDNPARQEKRETKRQARRRMRRSRIAAAKHTANDFGHD